MPDEGTNPETEAAVESTAAPSPETPTESSPPPARPDGDVMPFIGRTYVDAELRPHQYWKLRTHCIDMLGSIATRLSLHLRVPVQFKLNGMDAPDYESYRRKLATPVYIALVKAEPSEAKCLVAIPPVLGLAIADRLMGGVGVADDPERSMSDIEAALVDQVVEILMEDCFKSLPGAQEYRPVVIAHERHPSLLKRGRPEERMLALSVEAIVGEAQNFIEIGIGYDLITGLLSQFRLPESGLKTPVVGQVSPRNHWTQHLQGLPLKVEAGWHPVQLQAGQLGRLRVGDVVPLDASFVETVELRIGPRARFQGRLGSIEGVRAVQITRLSPLSKDV